MYEEAKCEVLMNLDRKTVTKVEGAWLSFEI